MTKWATAEGIDWEKFFAAHENYLLEAWFYECNRTFTVEECYQAFKARLHAESRPDIDTLRWRAMVPPKEGSK